MSLFRIQLKVDRTLPPIVPSQAPVLASAPRRLDIVRRQHHHRSRLHHHPQFHQRYPAPRRPYPCRVWVSPFHLGRRRLCDVLASSHRPSIGWPLRLRGEASLRGWSPEGSGKRWRYIRGRERRMPLRTRLREKWRRSTKRFEENILILSFEMHCNSIIIQA